jgi:hypothetical protein
MGSRRKPFNVSRIYDPKRREESGVTLSRPLWGIFENGTERLVATATTRGEAIEAARQLNDENERAASESMASSAAGRLSVRGA